MRIAVIDWDKCQPKTCSRECIRYCPRVRTGDETIVMEEGKPVISEDLCIGCGICVHKCPFKAIHIVGVAEELKGEIVHQFGENDFRLFHLPRLSPGKVSGILGQNGIGKTTALKILSGELKQNLGEWEHPPSWDDICEYWKKTEMYSYFSKLSQDELKISVKPQYVENFSEKKETVESFLENIETQKDKKEVLSSLDLLGIENKKLSIISGGELQRVVIAGAILRDADIYFFDEPSSYLDITHRLCVAREIRNLAQDALVMVVEHDLAVLDFLADTIHILYGEKGVYGIVTQPKSVRHGINLYLSGYLKEENIRFAEEVTFEVHPPRQIRQRKSLISFHDLEKKFDDFTLKTSKGKIHEGEVIGVVGANATGKTTFVKLLAGVIQPTKGTVDSNVTISYKPQYLKPGEGTVQDVFLTLGTLTDFCRVEVVKPLLVDNLFDKKLTELSGGELQTVALALALSRKADMYLIDEPSAYLDSTQRMRAARVIKRKMEKEGTAALVVDHDVYFIDMVSESLMVFDGKPGKWGKGEGPFDLHTGMNMFLKNIDVTFRRDEESGRPRVNKSDSHLDKKQKSNGEYYYQM